MINAALLIFLFVVVIAITAVLLFGWIIFSVIKLIYNGVSRIGTTTPQPPKISATTRMRCLRQGCWAENPVDARFCRRCGQPLPQPHHVQVRRAAVW
jgi:hypothetical protein